MTIIPSITGWKNKPRVVMVLKGQLQWFTKLIFTIYKVSKQLQHKNRTLLFTSPYGTYLVL